MADVSHAVVNIDGGSRGNPGPASYAVVLRRSGFPTVEECDVLGKATNNVAEYTALLRALSLAKELGLASLEIQSDSELLVKQMNGDYRVKNADLIGLYGEAKQLAGKFRTVEIVHVRREQNKDADKLCNEALDGRPRPRGSKPDEMPDRPVLGDAARDRALATLAHAAESWARHGLASPNIDDVLTEIEKHLASRKVTAPRR